MLWVAVAGQPSEGRMPSRFSEKPYASSGRIHSEGLPSHALTHTRLPHRSVAHSRLKQPLRWQMAVREVLMWHSRPGKWISIAALEDPYI